MTGAEQIRQREFATVRRGYDPDQVRAYLGSLAAHVDELERALAESRARIGELRSAPPTSEPDPYERLSERFAGVLASADTEAQQVVDEAKSEAARIRSEAQAQAEDLRNRSSRSLIAAQQETDRVLENLATRRASMLGQLHDMQARLLAVADDLEVAIQPASDATASPEPTTIVPEAAGAPEPAGTPEPVPSHAVTSAASPTSETPRGADTRSAETPASQRERAAVDVGIAALFDDPPADEVDLPDLSGIDLDLDLDDERGER
ncbi:MAG TPA: DivIVA domain-containing protein [Actinomycetota bacterium]|nr:DivIVA domain-containing protein [Actinomycetota bacterium]